MRLPNKIIPLAHKREQDYQGIFRGINQKKLKAHLKGADEPRLIWGSIGENG